MKRNTFVLATLCLFGFIANGCKSSPAAPFDQLEASNLVAYRLQNFEPPPSAPAAQPGQGLNIPGLPPEIQQWIQQGAQALPQLIPPGLLPPGMFGQGAPAPAPQETVPRFHGFRILSQTQVIDKNLKEELAELLGDADNFSNEHAACGYAEMGLSFSQGMPGQPGVPSNDLLISFSCNQIIARTFAWPHPSAGLKGDTVKDLSSVVQKLWPPGT
jgi:hypothetical protein